MAPDEDLAPQVQALLSEELLIRNAAVDADLLETGMLDSLTVVKLLVQLEDRFGLKLEMENLEIEDLRSIRSITRLIRRCKATGAAA